MRRYIEKFISFLLAHRFVSLGVVFAGTAVMAFFLTRIKVDNDTTKTIPDDLPAKIDHQRINQTFSTPYTLLFIAEFDTLALTEKIDSIASWAGAFDSIPGIEKVVHLGTVQIPIRGGFFGIGSDYLVSKTKKLSEAQLRERIAEHRAFTGPFVSDDESVLGMIIALEEEIDRPEVIRGIFATKQKIDERFSGSTYIASEAAVSYFIDKAMRRNLSLLLPLSLLLVFLLLYWVFRKFSHVISALLVMVVTLIWTFGLMGLLGVPFSIVSSVIPVILFPIGVADAIHIIRTYTHLRALPTGSRNAALGETFAELSVPCLLTSITTFVGFSSFAVSDISWTSRFGVFTGIGVLFAFVFTMVLLPLLLSFDKKVSENEEASTEKDSVLGFWLIGLHQWSRKPLFWVGLSVLLLGVVIVGFSRIQVEANPIEMFSPSSQVKQSDEIVARQFGGTRFFSVMVESKDTALTGAEQWSDIDSIATFIRKQPGVGNVGSLVPLLSSVSTMLGKEGLSDAAISLLLSSKGLFSKSFSSYLQGWVGPDRERTKLSVTVANDPRVHISELASDIRKYIYERYPEYEVLIAGPALLIDAMIGVIVRTQISSLIAAFIPVLLLLCLLYRSVRIGFFAVVPIALATLFVYALMGLLGISVNIVTVIIVNTCIGIGIDYAIHFVSGYLFMHEKGLDKETALLETIKRKGAVIVLNAVSVGTGFLVLSLSDFPPIRHFGLVVFIAMIVSSLFSLIFLPIQFIFFGRKKNDAVVKEGS